MCDGISGGLGLLQKEIFSFGAKLSICCFLQEEICSHRALHSLHEELLRAGEKQVHIVLAKTESAAYAHCHTLSVRTHLALLYFSFQAVKAVENKVPVQLIAGTADKPPNCFSLRFKALPGAQCCLITKKKQHYNVHGQILHVQTEPVVSLKELK